MKDFLKLDTMITPKIITIIYWFGLVGVSLTSMSMLFGIGRYAYTNFGMRFLMAIFVIIFGLVIVRVYSELLIVIFKIHDNLKKIADKS